MKHTVALALFCGCLFTFASSSIGQTRGPARAATEHQKTAAGSEFSFKLELFRSAMNLGIPRSRVNEWGGRVGEDEATLEVATALRADDVYHKWLQNADESERQYIVSAVARNAAKYGRTDLALEMSQQLKEPSKKLEVLMRITFLLGHEGKTMQFQQLLDDLERMHDAEVDGRDKNKTKPFEEHPLAQWREAFLFAYHSGVGASGNPISEDDLKRDVSTVLFRDSVRAYRACKLMRDAKHEQALATVREMESELMQVNFLHSLIVDLPQNRPQIKASNSELGELLFKKFHALEGGKDHAKSDVFKLFEEFDLGEVEPIDGLPLVADELIRDVFDLNGFRLKSMNVLAACIESGFCKDGLRAVKMIDDKDLRAAWLKSVLKRFETRGELTAAWETRNKYKSELGGGVKNDEAYLGQLVTWACRRSDFRHADSFLMRIEDEQQWRDARFTVAAHRQNKEDMELIRSRHATIFIEFKRDLASIDEEKQLEWLYKLGLHSLEERRLLILGDEIKRKFSARKGSESRNKVARQVHSAIHSMTPLPQTRQRFMEDLAVILGEKTNREGLDKILKQLRNQKPGELLNAGEKLSLVKTCVEARQNMRPNEYDQTLGKIAVACAVLGKQEVTKLVDLIESRTERFYTLLNCAMAFPPKSAPVFQGKTYRDRIQRGGLSRW